MAPVIWGLDLADMQWSKFKSSYMFGNTDWHLRRTKFIVYQCALIFCVVSESLGTAALSDYLDQQEFVHKLNPKASVANDDYIGAASYNIFAGVFVAFIFGAAFFFDLFWPGRRESQGVRWAWKICGVLATIFYLASAITLTVITADHHAHVTGVDEATGRQLISRFHKDHTTLIYRRNARAVAAVVFAWLGWISIVPSCILLFLSISNTEYGPGPRTAHARDRDQRYNSSYTDSEVRKSESDKPISEPAPTHQPRHYDGAEDAPQAAEERTSYFDYDGTVDAGPAVSAARMAVQHAGTRAS